MKIGVLGSGDVGKTLAAGAAKHGHQVMIGTREPAKLTDWSQQNPQVRLGTPPEIGAFAEMIVLAVKGSAASAALQGVGVGSLAGKVIIDANNPIADVPPVNGVLNFFTTYNDSLMER